MLALVHPPRTRGLLSVLKTNNSTAGDRLTVARGRRCRGSPPPPVCCSGCSARSTSTSSGGAKRTASFPEQLGAAVLPHLYWSLVRIQDSHRTAIGAPHGYAVSHARKARNCSPHAYPGAYLGNRPSRQQTAGVSLSAVGE